MPNRECKPRHESGWRPFAVFLIVCVLLSTPFSSSTQPATSSKTSPITELSSLRQGRVLIHAAAAGAELKIDYEPAYGWDEPLLLYGPDGRLVQRFKLGHKSAGSLRIPLDRGAGAYELILKPSYVCRVAAPGEMVYLPPEGEPGLMQKPGEQALYFKVGAGTAAFDLLATNHRHYRGSAGTLRLFAPDGHQAGTLDLPAVDPDKIVRAAMGLTPEQARAGQKGTDVLVTRDPVPPRKIHVDRPAAGFWKIEAGSGGLTGRDNIGIWLEGVPSQFAPAPESWWEPPPRAVVKARLEILAGERLRRPCIGIVGNFGAPGNVLGKALEGLGFDGDNIYLWQGRDAPAYRTATAGAAAEVAYAFKDHALLAPRAGVYSLIMFRGLADWMPKLPRQEQLREWSRWVALSAAHIVGPLGRQPESFAVQFMNEPNLEMPIDDYLALLKSAGARLRADPRLARVRIAAPGLGSGEEQEIVDLDWIRRVLNEAGTIVDVVSFNLYRVQELEDTFLYGEALREVHETIVAARRDSRVEDIIIGSTNRQGGFAPARLFDSWEAALWWGSVLCQVTNSNLAKAVFYYNDVDKGIRAKGIFTENGRMKPQGRVQALFAQTLKMGEIFRVKTDHEALEGLAVRNPAGGAALIVLNKGKNPLDVALEIPWAGLRLKKVEECGMRDAECRIWNAEIGAREGKIRVPPESIMRLSFE